MIKSQNSKVKWQNYNSKVKSFALLFNFIHQPCAVLVQGQLADSSEPVLN